jgi:hypothetical protein
MTLRLQALTIGAVFGLLAACASTTTFDSIWKAPNVKGVSPVGKTVVAVFVSRDISQRRAAEDEMVKDLNKRGAHGIAAYSILPNDKGADADAARAVFKAEGANAVVVMRLVGKDQKVTYTPGSPAPTYYGNFGPYWGYGWGAAYQPGYLSTDVLVSLETTIYSLDRDELLWAATSRTANPSDVKSLVNEVAEATANQMVLEGILAPK